MPPSIPRFPKPSALVLIALFAGFARAADAPAVVRSIELPEVKGRIDHLAYAAEIRALYVAALGNNSVEAVDLTKGAHTLSVKGFPEPQGIVFLPGQNLVAVTCGGDGSLRLLEAGTLKEVRRADLKSDADNMRYDEAKGLLYAAHGDGAVSAVDAASAKTLATVALDAHPESLQLDAAAQKLFVNVPGAGHVAVVDLAKNAVAARWPVADAKRNYPMALDAKAGRLFVGCRAPARLLVYDTQSGKPSAALDCVGDIDDIFLDKGGARAYLIGGEGFVDVVDRHEQDGSWRRTARTPTRKGARTGLLVPEEKRLFVAAPAAGGLPAAVLELTLP